MLFVAAALLGAFAAAGVGAVINGLTGAAIGAVIGTIVSVAHMMTVMRQKQSAALAWLVIIAAVLCGLMAGFFFAFSFLVMRALEAQPGVAGMPVMQTINVVVFNPVFGIAFTAAPAFCVFAMNAALVHRRSSVSTYALAGGALYLVGTLYVTVLCNVPRNDALALVPATSSAAASVWATYLSEWTAWNDVRTYAAFIATALLTIGIGYPRRHEDAPRTGQGRD